MGDGTNNFNMDDYNFLPSLEYRLLQKDSQEKLNSYGIDVQNEDNSVNYKKLSRYIKFMQKVKYREKGSSYYVTTYMRPCTVQDFKDKQVEIQEDDVSSYESRICPDWSDAKVQNRYSNQTYRVSTSLDIVLCTFDGDCEKNQTKVEMLVKNLFFTLYMVRE